MITEEDALRACQKAGVEIAVPDDEQEPVRRVVVEVSGGCAEVVELDPGVTVEIRDYDCQGCELTGDPDCTDAKGEHCHIYQFEGPVPVDS